MWVRKQQYPCQPICLVPQRPQKAICLPSPQIYTYPCQGGAGNPAPATRCPLLSVVAVHVLLPPDLQPGAVVPHGQDVTGQRESRVGVGQYRPLTEALILEAFLQAIRSGFPHLRGDDARGGRVRSRAGPAGLTGFLFQRPPGQRRFRRSRCWPRLPVRVRGWRCPA